MIVCFMNSNGIVNVWFTIIFSSLKNAILNLFHVRVYILLDTQIMKNNKLEILCFFFGKKFWKYFVVTWKWMSHFILNLCHRSC
jgi:hypothetical protein